MEYAVQTVLVRAELFELDVTRLLGGFLLYIDCGDDHVSRCTSKPNEHGCPFIRPSLCNTISGRCVLGPSLPHTPIRAWRCPAISCEPFEEGHTKHPNELDYPWVASWGKTRAGPWPSAQISWHPLSFHKPLAGYHGLLVLTSTSHAVLATN